MKKTRTYVYPTWYWLWSTPTRYALRIATGAIFLGVLYGLTKQQWLLSLLLTPLLLVLILTSGDNRFKRGYVPVIIRKRMLKGFSSELLNKYEALHVLGRIYERSAVMSVPKPKDAWLTRFYVGLAFIELAKSEQDSPEAYNELREYIFKKYYPV